MPNINDVVGFKYGSQSEYDGRSVDGSDVNNLFFTTDTKRMYVGPEEYTRPVMSGDSVPSFSTTPMSLFIRNVSSSGVEGTVGYTPAHKEVYYNSSGSSGDWVLVVSGNTGTVRYDIIQSLSDEQKVRARDNIGADAEGTAESKVSSHNTSTDSHVDIRNSVIDLKGQVLEAKTKLDSVATGAEVNQNAFSNIVVGDTTIAANSKTGTLTFEAGSNIVVTPDVANNKIIFDTEAITIDEINTICGTVILDSSEVQL